MSAYRVVIALVMAGLLTTGIASAKEGHPKKKGAAKSKDVFAQYDVDKSGTLSLAEFTAMEKAKLEKRKARMGDKWDEAKAAKRPTAAAVFKRKDADKSGDLSKEEMKKRPAKGRKGKAAIKAEA